jgi:hypothetical protein
LRRGARSSRGGVSVGRRASGVVRVKILGHDGDVGLKGPLRQTGRFARAWSRPTGSRRREIAAGLNRASSRGRIQADMVEEQSRVGTCRGDIQTLEEWH